METRYNVCCWNCGKVWTPVVKSSLWWQAKQREEKGYLDALHVNGEVCGCQKTVVKPDAPYRVVGYTDMFDDFNIPFESIVEAARKYLEIAREGMCTVYFVTKWKAGSRKLTRVEERLKELEWIRA